MASMAIVVVGYNREKGMVRLLNSLAVASYADDRLDLIISLDYSGKKEIIAAAEEFSWTHGKKIVRAFDKRQGLRKHILACGDYLDNYDAIAVFEDDIVVSPAFYEYMKQAVEYYAKNNDVAGISLYTHKINVNVNAPFIPEKTSYDVYYHQFAQSWGQVWMKNQWHDFKQWYEENSDKPIDADNVPSFVSGWPSSSWLKYHIKYCIEKNKYFVYPYHSLSTCFSDVGEHCKEENTVYQVPMMGAYGMKYRFCNEIDKMAVYDAFFERKGLEKKLKLPEGSLCTNLYGHKIINENCRYLLTTQTAPYEVIRTFGLIMRPHECNILYEVNGNGIYLYDVTRPSKEKSQKPIDGYHFISYYYNINSNWKLIREYVKERIMRKFRKR